MAFLLFPPELLPHLPSALVLWPPLNGKHGVVSVARGGNEGPGFMLFLWNMGRGMQHLKPESVWRGRDSVGSVPRRALILGKVQVGTTVTVGGHHHLLSPVLHFSRQGLNSFGQNLLSAQLRVWNLTVNKMQFLPSGHQSLAEEMGPPPPVLAGKYRGWV